MPIPAPDWQPTKAERQALGPQARLLLDSLLRLYRLDDVEGRAALLALRSLSMVEAMEARVAQEGWTFERVTVDGAGVEHREEKPHPLLPAIARERRLFISQWAALRLGRP